MPPEVERFSEVLADWLASFTVPAGLGAAMAEACAAGSAWPGAIGAAAVRHTGWSDTEALAWGIANGALAGALEAGGESLDREADGSAPLLAADGLIAAAHEALASLAPERLSVALRVLADEFGDGGPWRHLASDRQESRTIPAWARVMPCALGPAAWEEPDGPWREHGEIWRAAFADVSIDPDAAAALSGSGGGEPDMERLLEAAAVQAAGSRPE